MRCRILAALICLVALPRGGPAQEAAKVWRVGILAPSRRPEVLEALIDGLRERGYVEGRNLAVEYRVADGDYSRLPALAADLVRLPVDVLVADASPAAGAAEKVTQAIPIVFVVGGAVENGLVKSLAHPGGNATGISVLLRDVGVKDLEMLSRMVPRLSRVGVLSNPANGAHVGHLKNFQTAAESRGITVVSVQAGTPADIEGAFSGLEAGRVGALYWISDPFLNQQARLIADLSAKHRLPSITTDALYPSVGGLMSYGASQRAMWRYLAVYVDKVLRGANPGDLPVEQPTTFAFVVNRKTAKALGLTIPADLLVQADKVIE
ncbi:MAG TPA: ABC transporter substrate-binding protein [Thermoanaerobaculia bacterium]|nr:ABC transporter substrate-binding protein [Thermoanaerobaculia bacterium]